MCCGLFEDHSARDVRELSIFEDAEERHVGLGAEVICAKDPAAGDGDAVQLDAIQETVDASPDMFINQKTSFDAKQGLSR